MGVPGRFWVLWMLAKIFYGQPEEAKVQTLVLKNTGVKADSNSQINNYSSKSQNGSEMHSK